MNRQQPGVIYLLHFDQPYKHAKHYTGWTEDLLDRLDRHAAGRGARLVEVIWQAGLGFTLAAAAVFFPFTLLRMGLRREEAPERRRPQRLHRRLAVTGRDAWLDVLVGGVRRLQSSRWIDRSHDRPSMLE